MLNSIFETRTRLKDGYHISLSLPRDEYQLIYGNHVNNAAAKDILNEYLEYRDDDGQPDYIQAYDHDISNIVEIEAHLNYEGNDHRDYTTTHIGLFDSLRSSEG